MSRSALLREATAIAVDYKSRGYSLTLRQLYYQLVAGAVIPNADESYKRLGDTLGDARLDGRLDPDLIVDRGRNAKPSKHNVCMLNVNEAEMKAASWLRSMPYWSITTDRWFGQPIHVSVWVEKDALSGVFEKPCVDLGVGLFACKGYPSHSALWQWLKGLRDAHEISMSQTEDDEGADINPLPIKEAVVLYFGDHDPDGWMIPRSAEAATNQLAKVNDLGIPQIRFERIALVMDQIRKYSPPPFPAKISSSRYEGYVAEHGTTDAWELDALKPEVLERLIRSNVESLFDRDEHDRWKRFAATNRDRLHDRMKEDGWSSDAMNGSAP